VDHLFHLSHRLSLSTWLQKLAYLADIFTKVNELNLSLQGKTISIFTARDKISAFRCKLEIYGNSIKCKNMECFPTLSDFLVDTKSELQEVVFSDITQYLKYLQCMFLNTFPLN
jgi:hypothetical protein